MKSKIILKAEADLIDEEAREILNKLWKKVESINDRTKNQTIEIKEIKKKLSNLNL
jgi:hypothetical protein